MPTARLEVVVLVVVEVIIVVEILRFDEFSLD